ncbi:MAG: pyrroline-5-carboxylate reductase family protein [Oscillospiraceae bacterium]
MKIAIIGFGHLGKALARGLIRSGVSLPGEIYISARTQVTLTTAERELGVIACGSPLDAALSANIVFLTVKSAVFEDISPTLTPALSPERSFVSFMAGITAERTGNLLGKPIIRAMPSIAIAECEGTIGYTRAPSVIAGIFGKLGLAFEVEERDIEKVTAFSGCGLGFAAYILDAYAKAGEALGFSPELSHSIAAMTFKSAAKSQDFAAMAKAVATKGGATEAGVLHFEERELPEIIKGAMQSAYDKMTRR